MELACSNVCFPFELDWVAMRCDRKWPVTTAAASARPYASSYKLLRLSNKVY